MKGKPNLTVGQFCQSVNDDLVPNKTLEPSKDFNWNYKKVDDLAWIQYCTEVKGHIYRQPWASTITLVSLGFLNKGCAPNWRSSSEWHSPEVAKKTIILFHGESMFQSNEDKPKLVDITKMIYYFLLYGIGVYCNLFCSVINYGLQIESENIIGDILSWAKVVQTHRDGQDGERECQGTRLVKASKGFRLGN